MKSVSAALEGHLGEETTTLATCWRISRTDGKAFFFTDHDRDLAFEGNVYRAKSGYSRTAISNDASMAVDNLDVEGVFDSDEITETDLRAGLFDHAEARIFLVNWRDLSQGALRMRRGWFGEVTLSEAGVFRTELRGMTQALSRRIGEIYSPECRADLGDHRCKVPIDPPEVERDRTYAVGDTVKVDNSDAATGGLVNVPFVNPGFETGDTTGWTVSPAGSVDLEDTLDPDPHSGAWYAAGNTASATFELSQTADMAAALDLPAVDSEGYEFDFTVWRCNTGTVDSADEGRVRVQLLDAGDALISEVIDTGLTKHGNQWGKLEWLGLAVPVGTRKVRVFLEGKLASGSRVNVGYDDVGATFRERASAGTTRSVHFVNASFELRDATGWTVTTGSAAIASLGSSDPVADGGFYLRGGSTANLEVEQVVDMTSELDPIRVDNGEYTFGFSCDRGNDAGDTLDEGRVVVELLDASDVVAKIALDTGLEALEDIGVGGWQERSAAGVAVPAGTRKVRVRFVGVRQNGTTLNACLDDVRAVFSAPAASAGGSETPETYDVFENRIYRCIEAGTTGPSPLAYSRTVGDTVTDGTVRFVVKQAWTRHGEVTAITDRKTLEAEIDEARARDGWFAGGVVTWETGANAERSCEVRDWVQTTGTVTLFLPQPFDISPGDRFRIYPGCDKRLATCTGRFGNVLNFRGEPYLPGQDELMRYPDAK